MIQLTRKNIRAIRSTIRQSLGISNARKAPTVTFRATLSDLLIQAATDRIAIECRLPGNYQPERFAIPYEALGAVEGKQDDLVSLTKRDDIGFLLTSTKRLPGASEPNSPVTVDLNGVVAIRAVAEDQSSPTELVLSNSRRGGKKSGSIQTASFLTEQPNLDSATSAFATIKHPLTVRTTVAPMSGRCWMKAEFFKATATRLASVLL